MKIIERKTTLYRLRQTRQQGEFNIKKLPNAKIYIKKKDIFKKNATFI